MSEHRISPHEAELMAENGVLRDVMAQYGIKIVGTDDGGFTVKCSPRIWCPFCNEIVIQPGDDPNRDAITQHTNNCERNPLVQEVKALRAAAHNIVKWPSENFISFMRPEIEALDAALHHIYDGSETDG